MIDRLRAGSKMKKFMVQMAFTFLISFFAVNVYAQESIKPLVPLSLKGIPPCTA